MESEFTHMVTASKVPMLKPEEYELWKMRMKQYLMMLDYSMWDVIVNCDTLPLTEIDDKDVEKPFPIKSSEQNA